MVALTPSELLDEIILAEPVLPELGVADEADAIQARLIQDVAYNHYSADELAKRYGLGSEAGLRHYLRRHPNVVERIAKLRAVHRSDMNRPEANRMKANILIEEALPMAMDVIMNPKNPMSVRMDMFKSIQKMAGLDSTPQKNIEATTGATFNLVMQFSGGREERISATVVPNDEIAIPRTEDDDA